MQASCLIVACAQVLALAKVIDQLEALDIQLVVVCVERLVTLKAWQRSLEKKLGRVLPFPLVSDCHRELATKYGIMAKDAASDSQTGRSVFLLEPEGHISAAFHYPLLFGRSTDDCITVTTSITR